MQDLTSKIKSIIKKYFTEGKANKLKTDGFEEIKIIIKRYGGFWKDYQKQIQQLTKSVQDELQTGFLKERLTTESAFRKEELAKILKQSEKNINTNQRKIFRAIEKSLTLSTNTKQNWEDITRKTLKELELEEHHIETNIFTTKMALNNLNAIKDYEKANIEYVQYSGPTGTLRSFCKEHIGKIYTLEEAKKLKNDFGQNAFVWVGGYNCRHRWDAVIDKITYKDKSGGKVFIDKNFVETEGGEITIAKLRAKTGINVQLKNKIDNIKSADAFEDGIKTEYKRITEKAVNLRSAVQRSLREAKEQAGSIVVYVDKNNYNLESIQKGIKSAIYHDKKKKINKINIINRYGEVIKND